MFRIASARSVEQLLGRVLRMPYTKRRKDAALNMAYAHLAEPSFAEVSASLRDKLIGRGFTDEEVRRSLRPDTVEQDNQVQLFDPDPVAPKPTGALKVGMKGAVTGAVATALERYTPEADRPTLRAENRLPRGACGASADASVGRLWAKKTGTIYLTVRRLQHGTEPTEQMQHIIDN
jgi:type III restriction enzyme